MCNLRVQFALKQQAFDTITFWLCKKAKGVRE
ncbi:hypothetical protein HH_0898 [Helicobacter hepaticus ATCC 51449]|uniref:Uncharacterized protein n=1 Tax=Helicobacter hepaticus (strain ATCC 51449 / 3B1) TaxID=235279 RepID=Q7VHR5_HELHP|nr:hypothetical protein HH_0898 [Helicobacter hepaticus ATCC 51449]